MFKIKKGSQDVITISDAGDVTFSGYYQEGAPRPLQAGELRIARGAADCQAGNCAGGGGAKYLPAKAPVREGRVSAPRTPDQAPVRWRASRTPPGRRLVHKRQGGQRLGEPGSTRPVRLSPRSSTPRRGSTIRVTLLWPSMSSSRPPRRVTKPEGSTSPIFPTSPVPRSGPLTPPTCPSTDCCGCPRGPARFRCA